MVICFILLLFVFGCLGFEIGVCLIGSCLVFSLFMIYIGLSFVVELVIGFGFFIVCFCGWGFYFLDEIEIFSFIFFLCVEVFLVVKDKKFCFIYRY